MPKNSWSSTETKNYKSRASAQTKVIEKKIELSEKIVDSIKATVEKQTEIVTEYETIFKEIESEYKDVEKPKDSVCLEDYYKYKKSNDNLKLQIVYKDSIIQTKDTIIKGLKHIIREKDMIILEKDKHIEVLSKPKKSKAKPFGIGLQVGATYNGGELKEYIGGGIWGILDKKKWTWRWFKRKRIWCAWK